MFRCSLNYRQAWLDPWARSASGSQWKHHKSSVIVVYVNMNIFPLQHILLVYNLLNNRIFLTFILMCTSLFLWSTTWFYSQSKYVSTVHHGTRWNCFLVELFCWISTKSICWQTLVKVMFFLYYFIDISLYQIFFVFYCRLSLSVMTQILFFVLKALPRNMLKWSFICLLEWIIALFAGMM